MGKELIPLNLLNVEGHQNRAFQNKFHTSPLPQDVNR